MIDFSKPIQTRDGREAKYLGELPDGRHVIACDLRTAKSAWGVDAYSEAVAERFFENTPPAPPKLTGYCPIRKRDSFVGWQFADMKEFMADPVARHEDWAIDLSTLTAANLVRVER